MSVPVSSTEFILPLGSRRNLGIHSVHADRARFAKLVTESVLNEAVFNDATTTNTLTVTESIEAEVSGTVVIQANTSTAADAINIGSSSGGVYITSGDNIADAIRISALNSAGGIQLSFGSGGLDMQGEGPITLDGGAASNIVIGNTAGTGSVDISTVGGRITTIGNTTAAASVILRNGASGQLSKSTSPQALNATGNITTAMLLGKILTSTTAAAVNGTTPSAAAIVAACPDCIVGDTLSLKIVNTGGNSFTILAGAGVTIVGNAVIATNTSRVVDIRIDNITGSSEAVTFYC
jgi:hypothetical protein